MRLCRNNYKLAWLGISQESNRFTNIRNAKVSFAQPINNIKKISKLELYITLKQLNIIYPVRFSSCSIIFSFQIYLEQSFVCKLLISIYDLSLLQLLLISGV